MDTTTAAKKATVTAATIRAWCRMGAIAATKTSGRWDIETSSLAHRIRIGTRSTDTYVRIDRHPKARAGAMPKSFDGKWSYGIDSNQLTPGGHATRDDAELAAAVEIAARARTPQTPTPVAAPSPPRRGWSKSSARRRHPRHADGYCPRCKTDDYACDHTT